uniref:RING-type domain-containing protein n=1 Tax=Panagrolaimus davidi TaxID=227884 RepID=A0A914PJW3_9BILA
MGNAFSRKNQTENEEDSLKNNELKELDEPILLELPVWFRELQNQSLERPRSKRCPRTSVRSTEGVKKKTKVQCCACAQEVEASHGGRQCRQGHHICLNGCVETYIDSQLADGLSAVPLKCPLCKIEYNENIVERVMKIKQMDKYVRLVLTKKLQENPDNAETLVTCPNCNYYEYRHANAKEIMFYSDVDIMADSDDESDDENEFNQHMECHELQNLKLRFEKLLEKGQGGECPKCHLIGNKNPGDCNHMTCPECGTVSI